MFVESVMKERRVGASFLSELFACCIRPKRGMVAMAAGGRPLGVVNKSKLLEGAADSNDRMPRRGGARSVWGCWSPRLCFESEFRE